MNTPTKTTYDALQAAYDNFNKLLFAGHLPGCLITLQRKKNCYGYHAHERFGDKEGNVVCNEISLNPDYFDRDSKAILSTLAHEMCHLQQDCFGKPTRKGYHDKAWGALMEAIGLIPSSTGAAGGKKTGQKVSHYIEKDGKFDIVVDAFLEAGFDTLLIDLWAKNKLTTKPKAESKTKYLCPSCGLNAWAKPYSTLVCGDCQITMPADI